MANELTQATIADLRRMLGENANSARRRSTAFFRLRTAAVNALPALLDAAERGMEAEKSVRAVPANSALGDQIAAFAYRGRPENRAEAERLGFRGIKNPPKSDPVAETAGEMEDDRREELKNAFVAGCVAVAEYFGHPTDDFDEAGYDYATSISIQRAAGDRP